MSNFEADPIFLCGHRKAGTSLFLNLLDGHPALSVYPIDTNFLYGYFPTHTREGYSDMERAARFDRVVFDELSSWLGEWNVLNLLDVPRFRAGFLQALGGNWSEIGAIIRAFATSFNSLPGATAGPFVMKESSIEIYAAELFSHFPRAKFIHLLRDPRDNFAALNAGVATYYARLGEDRNATLASLLHRARLGFQFAQVNQQLYGAERYLVIKFEDLVETPRKVLETVCAFLNVPWADSVLTPTKLGSATKGNSFDGFDFSKISGRNVGRWRERITAEDAATIEFHFANLMDDFGYAREASQMQQARAAGEFYKWQNYKYFFSDRFASGIKRD
jgi:hypothetical protein